MDSNRPPSRRSSSPARQPSLLPSAIPRESTSSGAAGGPSISSTHLEPRSPTRQTPVSSLAREASANTNETASGAVVTSGTAFAPFFTLVEDAHSSTVRHPVVRYIFSDDEGDTLTDTLLRLHARSAGAGGSTATSRTVGPGTPTTSRRGAGNGSSGGADEATAVRSLGGSHAARAREHAVVVTLGSDGRSVVTAHSLTGDWQVLRAEVAAAPTLEGEEGETGGMMLRIVGTNATSVDRGLGPGEGIESAAAMEAAVERYRERMEELRLVAEAGRERER